jgi:hypothetical protein
VKPGFHNRYYNGFTTEVPNAGAPEEIRTPDPQIRSLVPALDFIEVVVECELIRETFQCRDGSIG